MNYYIKVNKSEDQNPIAIQNVLELEFWDKEIKITISFFTDLLSKGLSPKKELITIIEGNSDFADKTRKVDSQRKQLESLGINVDDLIRKIKDEDRFIDPYYLSYFRKNSVSLIIYGEEIHYGEKGILLCNLIAFFQEPLY